MLRNILSRILETKRKEVEDLRARHSEAEWKALASKAPRVRNFFRAVTKRPLGRANLIAEIKKASPSAGVICRNYDPSAIARRYASAGADALSVLTDGTYFQGGEQDLLAARQAVDLPVLRKDFIIDPAQVHQSRAMGADAILLIAAALRPGELMDLMILATELRLTCLIEVHSADELMQVRSMVGFPHASYGLLGINNRDLTTFRTDLNTTVRLAELAGEGAAIVSESGIRTGEDVRRVASAGAKAILVGETLMRSADVGRTVAELLGLDERGGKAGGTDGG